MILVMINGQKTAIPVDAPQVYSFSEAEAVSEGGTAEELAVQVVSALVKSLKLPQTVLSSLIAHQADGQYQAKKFLQRLKSSTQGENQALPVGHDIFFVISEKEEGERYCGALLRGQTSLIACLGEGKDLLNITVLQKTRN